MRLTSIAEQIPLLSPAERVRLIDMLWQSLDDNVLGAIESKWAAECEARIDAVERGDLTTVDGPTALRELHLSLRK